MSKVVSLNNNNLRRSNSITRAILNIPEKTNSKNSVGVNFPVSKASFYRFYLQAISALQHAVKINPNSTSITLKFTEVRRLLKMRQGAYVANEGKASEVVVPWQQHVSETFRSFCLVTMDEQTVDNKNQTTWERTDVVFISVECDLQLKEVTFEFNPLLVPELLALKTHYSNIDLDMIMGLSSYSQMRMSEFLFTYQNNTHTPIISVDTLKRFLGYGPLVKYKKLKNQYLKGIQKTLAAKTARTFVILEEHKNSVGEVVSLKIMSIASSDYSGYLTSSEHESMTNVADFKNVNSIMNHLKSEHNFQKSTVLAVIKKAQDAGMSARKLKSLSTEEIRKRFL